MNAARMGGAGVVEAQFLARVHRRAQGHQHLAAHSVSSASLDGGDLQGVDPVPQPGRHHLADRAQGPIRGLLDACARSGGAAQGDGQRDRLLVVKQQRGQVAAGFQPVPAIGPLDGPDRVAEFAQPVDVAADRANADLQPLDQLVSGPVTSCLQQREQRQQSRRGFPHVFQPAASIGQRLSATAVMLHP